MLQILRASPRLRQGITDSAHVAQLDSFVEFSMLKILFFTFFFFFSAAAGHVEQGTTENSIKQTLNIWALGRTRLSSLNFQIATKSNQVILVVQMDTCKQTTSERPGKHMQNCTEARLNPGIEPQDYIDIIN